MSEGTVRTEAAADGVVVLRLDRPPVNALNPGYLAAIERALDVIEDDAAARAVVLAGAGATLSGGMDLKELQSFDRDDQTAMVDALNATYARIYGFPKPVVCAAHGPAIAGGLFFVLVSDYRVAGARASFGLAEVRVGVRFPVGPLEIARAELSPSACRRLMLGGRSHDAPAALAMGVVDEVVEGDRVLERAIEVATDYAAIPPGTFAAVKRQLRGAVLDRVADAIERRSDPMRPAWFGDETVAATRAILAGLRKG